MAAARPRPVLVEFHVQHPVHRLDRPVRPDRLERPCRIHRKRRDEEARLRCRFAGLLVVGLAFDHAGAAQALPGRPVLKPVDLRGLPARACHHLSARAVHGPGRGEGLVEGRIEHEGADFLVHGRLVSLERDDIVAPAFDDLSHVLLLASGRVDRDEASFQKECFEQVRNGCDFVGLLVGPDLREHDLVLPGKSAHDARPAAVFAERAAQDLAVECQRVAGQIDDAPRPGQDRRVEALRVEVLEHVTELVVARDAVSQRQESLQEPALLPSEERIVGVARRPADHRADDDREHFPEREFRAAGDPEVGYAPERVDQWDAAFRCGGGGFRLHGSGKKALTCEIL